MVEALDVLEETGVIGWAFIRGGKTSHAFDPVRMTPIRRSWVASCGKWARRSDLSDAPAEAKRCKACLHFERVSTSGKRIQW